MERLQSMAQLSVFVVINFTAPSLRLLSVLDRWMLVTCDDRSVTHT